MTHWLKTFGCRLQRRGRKGIALVEFALGSGVLLATFSGTFEVGYAVIQYDKLQTAVAQGARYASLIPYDSASTAPSSAFLSAVQRMVVYGNPTGGSSPVVPGLAAKHVSLKVSFANGVPSSMQVCITGYKINALFGSFTLTGKPQVSYRYQGVWAPA
ncbi:MAG: pilus assembly protein [Candidatus Sulfopaludibacter sp.]|nr:pilus assembly protein [Candidatus Sulfopaludibacter sp.]